jgi:hypothetical protein
MESQWHQVQNEIQQISYQMKQEAAKGIELLNMTGEGKCQLKKS